MKSSSSKLGLTLFFIYLLLYAGFVFLNAFAHEQMEVPVIAGLNLAVVYGFGLIVGAIVLSGMYGLLCRNESTDNETTSA